jgi:hypothetical protein
LRAERPDLPVLFCSGYTDVFEFDMAQPGAPTAFLAKPFTVQALTDKVAEFRVSGGFPGRWMRLVVRIRFRRICANVPK